MSNPLEEIAEYLAKSDESEFVYLVPPDRRHYVAIRNRWEHTVADVTADTFDAAVTELVSKLQEGRR